jgi:hypothetical protein
MNIREPTRPGERRNINLFSKNMSQSTHLIHLTYREWLIGQALTNPAIISLSVDGWHERSASVAICLADEILKQLTMEAEMRIQQIKNQMKQEETGPNEKD